MNQLYLGRLARVAFCLGIGVFAAACAASSGPEDVEPTGEQSAALANNGGGLGCNGDACSITGGPLKGKSGTRSGDFCCTEPNGGGHCQDCTTPSGWCSSKTKVSGTIFVPVTPPKRAIAP